MKNFKDILLDIKAHPYKVFGFIYPYFLVIGLVLGLYYIANMNDVARKKVLPALPDSAKAEGIKFAEAKSIPPVDVKVVGVESNEMVTAGQALYTKVCASCHGVDGKGAGPGSTGLNPPPRNFTNADNWKNGTKISGIYKTLEEGFTGTAMVPYDYLTPEEKFSLAHYVRKTYVPNPPKDSDAELQTLDQTYSLSQGKQLAAQISLTDAKKIYLSEQGNKAQQVSAILAKFDGSKREKGNTLFNRVVKNNSAAIYWLQNSNALSSVQDFRRLVLQNINQNGFNNKSYSLSDSEWNELYNYLLKSM